MWISQDGCEIYKPSPRETGKGCSCHCPPEVRTLCQPTEKQANGVLCFRQRNQLEGETFDTFVKELCLLAMDCQFADMDNILIDRFIIGMAQTRVQERLLNEGKASIEHLTQQFKPSQQISEM